MGQEYGTVYAWGRSMGPFLRSGHELENNIRAYRKSNRVWSFWSDSAASGGGRIAGFCEHGDEPSGSVQGRYEFSM